MTPDKHIQTWGPNTIYTVSLLKPKQSCFWMRIRKQPRLRLLSHSIYLYLFAGDITQKGYEKKRHKLIRAYVPHAGGNLATSDSPLHTHSHPCPPPSVRIPPPSTRNILIWDHDGHICDDAIDPALAISGCRLENFHRVCVCV